MRKGDGLLVVAMAPSLPAAAQPEGFAASVTDSAGNFYDFTQALHYDQSPTVINRGAIVVLYICESSVADMEHDVATVTATWDNPVYDRSIAVFQMRPGDTTGLPDVIAHSAEHSAAIYAAAQVTLQAPNYTPARDFGMEFALITTSKPGGTGAFGAVGGFNGFFQPVGRVLVGSKQTYYLNPQTFGADTYTINNGIDPPFYFALGTLPGGVLVPAFNGVGQTYSLGANADKGIILFGKC